VGQQVRIIEEKLVFAKGAEQNFSTEIFRKGRQSETVVMELSLTAANV
jgi:hypothetical protein